MIEQQSELTHLELSTMQNLNSFDLAERLDALLGQHEALTNQLRKLQFEAVTTEQGFQSLKWHDLENEVVRLRSETEALKINTTQVEASNSF